LIPYVKLCVKAATKGCLFELWNTEQWKPGVTLNFDLTSALHVPNLAHEVIIEELNLPKAFSVTQNGFGPITGRSELTYEGKGERLRATATNDSGQLIPYVKLCVKTATKGCLFELWNTEQWKPGTTLNFDLTSSQHVPDLAHEVTIEALNLPKDTPSPAAPFTSIPAASPQPVSRPSLTNDAVIKLAKAGLSDDVIVAMVDNQAGEYSLDSDAVIALKQSGVSDRVISTMLNKSTTPAVPTPNAPHGTLTVKIIDRQDNNTDYTYVVPGHFNSQSNSQVGCVGGANTVNCNGSTTTSGSSMPAHQVSYHVRGATFTLQLPDGRAAVVNCESKFKERMAGPAGNHRSCRIPLVDNIQAEFHGDNAKLIWVVSLDGKKMQSETYKVLAVLDKSKSDQN
jgi:hypothetical protein